MTDPKINGNIWRQRKAAILRGFADAIRDVIQCETEVDKALLTSKLAHMQTEFTYLVDIFETESKRRKEKYR